MSAIQLLEDGSYYLESRGSKMTLVHDSDFSAWFVYTDNASHRAYRGPGFKMFDTLQQVEQNYKSWRGISQLVEATQSDTIN